MPLLLAEQLRAPSVQSAVALPNMLLTHDAGWTIASNEHLNVLFAGVREGRPGSAIGPGVGAGGADIKLTSPADVTIPR